MPATSSLDAVRSCKSFASACRSERRSLYTAIVGQANRFCWNGRSRQARILYCRDSGGGQLIFSALANALLAVNARRIRHACHRAGALALKSKSTMSLRGLVMDSLREGEYRVVLDHLRRTSAVLRLMCARSCSGATPP